jgi:transcriptional regulator with XRE-family HTH domain
MHGRERRAEVIPRQQAAVVGANIRALRQGRGWTQAQVGTLMGWTSSSSVCAAEGRRYGRQRSFTPDEVQQLANIFGVKTWQLTTRCISCEGHPPAGFGCLTCGAQAARPPGTAVLGKKKASG